MHILCLLVCYLTLLVFGGSVLVAAIHPVSPDLVSHVYGLVYESVYSRVFFGAVGMTIFFCALRVLQRRVAGASSDRSVKSRTAQGTVSVSLIALEDMLKKFLTGYDELADIRPFVYAKARGSRNNVRVVLRASLDHNGNIQQIASHIQENIKLKLQDILGTEDDIKVDLDIRRITIPQVGVAKKFVATSEQAKNVPYRNY